MIFLFSFFFFTFPVLAIKLITIMLDMTLLKLRFVRLTFGLYWPSCNFLDLRLWVSTVKYCALLVRQQIPNS